MCPTQSRGAARLRTGLEEASPSRLVLDFTRFLTLGALAALWACSSVFGPERRVELTLEVAPSSVTLGESVQLLGIAYNRTKWTIHPGVSCTPGLGFWVTDSTGVVRDVYDGLFHICPGRDDHTIEPEETDSVSFRWTPTTRGEFSVRTALIGGSGPVAPSAPVVVTVR